MDEYRFELQSLRSWVNEQFEAEETRLFLGSFACHAALGPDDMGGGAPRLALRESHSGVWATASSRAACTISRWPWPLTCVRRAGQIRTGARVSKIVVKDGRAVAVRLTDGEEIGVRQVVAVEYRPAATHCRFSG